MTLGQKIRALRQSKGLTLQAVGNLFGINRASVSEWESGKTKPEPDKLPALARALGTTIDDLLSREPLKERTAPTADPAPSSTEPAIAPRHLALLRSYLSLPEAQRGAVRRLIEALAEAQPRSPRG